MKALIVKVWFSNKDAKPKRRVLHCRRKDVPLILRWYDAYHWNDDYTVYVDGEKIKVDERGEPVGWKP
jgi:hypothetical protein